MTQEDIIIHDCYGKEIKVGDTVCVDSSDDETYAIIISISDPDGDYDDELQRGVEITPRITVKYNDGETGSYVTHNTTRMVPFEYVEPFTYMCDDLEKVVKNA